MSARKKVLFVCMGNSCRSPMAEALARHSAQDVIEPYSAGISPLGTIAEATRKVLLERGLSMHGQYSKGLREIEVDAMDLIVNMSGMPGQTMFPGAPVIDWDVDDPYGEELLIYREVCDDIEERLHALAAELRASSAPRSKV